MTIVGRDIDIPGDRVGAPRNCFRSVIPRLLSGSLFWMRLGQLLEHRLVGYGVRCLPTLGIEVRNHERRVGSGSFRQAIGADYAAKSRHRGRSSPGQRRAMIRGRDRSW